MLNSVKVFGVALIAIVLQLFPLTGVFLMMLAAPFWSVILVNLGFLLLAVESLTGVAPRHALAFPILWFGGYVVVAGISHLEASNFNAAIDAANGVHRLSWDRHAATVVIRPDRGDESAGSPLGAGWLIKSYGLDRAAEYQPELGGHRLTWLEEKECPGRMGVGIDDGRHWSKLHIGGYGQGEPMRFIDGVCLYTATRHPGGSIVTVETGPITHTKTAILETSIQSIRVHSPDGQELNLRAGYASPLKWFPMPVIGCALNSGAPSWDCVAGFQHEGRYDPSEDRTPYAADNVVARALGLSPLPLKERFASRLRPLR